MARAGRPSRAAVPPGHAPNLLAGRMSCLARVAAPTRGARSVARRARARPPGPRRSARRTRLRSRPRASASGARPPSAGTHKPWADPPALPRQRAPAAAPARQPPCCLANFEARRHACRVSARRPRRRSPNAWHRSRSCRREPPPVACAAGTRASMSPPSGCESGARAGGAGRSRRRRSAFAGRRSARSASASRARPAAACRRCRTASSADWALSCRRMLSKW